MFIKRGVKALVISILAFLMLIINVKAEIVYTNTFSNVLGAEICTSSEWCETPIKAEDFQYATGAQGTVTIEQNVIEKANFLVDSYGDYSKDGYDIGASLLIDVAVKADFMQDTLAAKVTMPVPNGYAPSKTLIVSGGKDYTPSSYTDNTATFDLPIVFDSLVEVNSYNDHEYRSYSTYGWDSGVISYIYYKKGSNETTTTTTKPVTTVTTTPVATTKPVANVVAPEVNTKEEVKEVTIGLNKNAKNDEIFAKALKNSKIDVTGKDVLVNVSLNTNVDANVTVENKNKMTNTLTNKFKGAKVAKFFDITLNVVDKANNNVLGNLTDLDEKVTFSIVLPNELKTVPNGYRRIYYIIREHNGVIEILPTDVAEDGNSLTFGSDKFSIYALAYEDTPKVNPQTSDSSVIYLALTSISLMGLIGYRVYTRKMN